MKVLTKKKKTTKYIVMTAVFVAVGYIVSFFEIPMPAPINFLQLDFSNVMTMLCGFTLGPVAMIVSEAIKQLLWFLTHSTTGGVGQIANFITAVSYAIIPSVAYKYKKGIKNVIIFLALGCAAQLVAALLSNLFITFPLFMATEVVMSVLPYLIIFNIGKSVIISILTLVLYKSLSRALKYIFGEEAVMTTSSETESPDNAIEKQENAEDAPEKNDGDKQ